VVDPATGVNAHTSRVKLVGLGDDERAAYTGQAQKWGRAAQWVSNLGDDHPRLLDIVTAHAALAHAEANVTADAEMEAELADLPALERWLTRWLLETAR